MFGWLRRLTGQSEPQVESAETTSAPQPGAETPSSAPISMPSEWAQPQVRTQSAPQDVPTTAAATPPKPRVNEPADYVVPEPPTVAVPEQRPAAPAASAAPAKPQPEVAVAEVETPTVTDAAAQTPEHATEAAAEPVAAQKQTTASVAATSTPSPAEVEVLDFPEAEDDDCDEPEHAQYDGLIPTPSARPAMPLSAHPNFAGLGLAPAPRQAPRLLEPEAALTPQAQQELLRLFEDLFGPRGRYRLEWRTGRDPGDDAVFSEIMTADLVRRVQNTIADVAELERPEPLRAIEPARDAEDDELKRAS